MSKKSEQKFDVAKVLEMVSSRIPKKELNDWIAKLPKPVDKQLNQLAVQTKWPKENIFGGIILFVGLLIFYFMPSALLFELAAGLYPAYATLRMLKTESYAKEADLWCTYWVLNFLVRLLLPFVDYFLENIVPLLSVFKLVGMVFLYQDLGVGKPGAQMFSEQVLKKMVLPKLPMPKSAPAPTAEAKEESNETNEQ